MTAVVDAGRAWHQASKTVCGNLPIAARPFIVNCDKISIMAPGLMRGHGIKIPVANENFGEPA